MKFTRALLISTISVLLIAFVTGCGASKDTIPESTPDGNTVIMQDHKFQPEEITIVKGESVTWINMDSAKHDVAGDSFTSDLLAKDETFEYTFDEAGTFAYSCNPHPYMKGTVIVTEQ